MRAVTNASLNARYRICLAVILQIAIAASLTMAQSSKTLHQFRLVHPNTPLSGITITPPGTVPTYSLQLPAAAPTNGQVLLTNGLGSLSWGSPTASFSSITAPVASNTIDNGSNALTWSWSDPSVGHDGFLFIDAPNLRSPQTSTTMRLSLTGANVNANQSTSTVKITNTRTGTGSVNAGMLLVGGSADVMLGPIDKAPTLLVTNGLTGFGTAAPSAIVHLGAGSNTANAGAPLKLFNSAEVSIGSMVNDFVAGEVGYWDSVFISTSAADMAGTMPSVMYRCLNDSTTGQSVSNLSWNNLFNTVSANPTVTLINGLYKFEILVALVYDWAFGFRFNVAAGGTVEYSWMSQAWGDFSTANYHVTFNTTNSNINVADESGGSSAHFLIRGVLRVTSQKADVTPQWYSKSSDNTVGIKRNSYLKISRLGGHQRVWRGKWD